MYYTMYIVGFALMMVLNVLCCKNYRISVNRTIFYTLITYFFGVAGAMLMGKIYTAVCEARGASDNSRVAIFGTVVFTPLFLLFAVAAENLFYKTLPKKTYKDKHGNRRLWKVKIESACDTMDLLTPGIFIILTCAKFGCFIEGCCFGVECAWGVHTSYHPDAAVFPVQIFEVASMCIVLLICYFMKRAKSFRRGMAFPLTAAFYTVTRFCWEFFRYYVPQMRNIHFGLTFWQLFCVGVFITSVVSLAVLYKKYPSDPLPKKHINS